MIPAGYIEALATTGDRGTKTLAPAASVVAAAPIVESQTQPVEPSVQSKPVEMSQYWYEQLTANEQEQVVNWAVLNRSQEKAVALDSSKEAEMFSYWFEKASLAERKEIIKQLLQL